MTKEPIEEPGPLYIVVKYASVGRSVDQEQLQELGALLENWGIWSVEDLKRRLDD